MFHEQWKYTPRTHWLQLILRKLQGVKQINATKKFSAIINVYSHLKYNFTYNKMAGIGVLRLHNGLETDDQLESCSTSPNQNKISRGPEFIFVLAPFNDARSAVSIAVNDRMISR